MFFFYSLPKAHDQGLEHILHGKFKALPSSSAPSSPQWFSTMDGCHEKEFWSALIKNVWELLGSRALNTGGLELTLPIALSETCYSPQRKATLSKKFAIIYAVYTYAAGGFFDLLCAKNLSWSYSTATVCITIKTQWWPSNPMAGHFLHSGYNQSALFLLYFGKTPLRCSPQGNKYRNTA